MNRVMGRVVLGMVVVTFVVLGGIGILTTIGVIKEPPSATPTFDDSRGKLLYNTDWPSHLGILVTDEGVCLDAKGVRWDGTPVTIYSSAKGTVDIQNTCRVFVAGGSLEIRDERAK